MHSLSESGNYFAGALDVDLLHKAAKYVEGILRVFGITTIGLDLSEELSASADQLLAVFTDFKRNVAQAPELQEVSSQELSCGYKSLPLQQRRLHHDFIPSGCFCSGLSV